MKRLPILALLAVLALAAAPAHAGLLAVDFGNATSPLEAGFFRQSSTTSAVHPTAAGNITVAFAGASNFDAATTGSNPDLYRDFFFRNGGPMTLTLSGPGISANTIYELTFWTFWVAQGRPTTFAPAGATTGPTLGPIGNSNNPTPVSLLDPLYSTSGTYRSDSSGVLSITIAGGVPNNPAINALQISAHPTLAGTNIVDNRGGGPVNINSLVTYTVTFSEDIDETTVSSTDFINAGTSPINFGAIIETTPGVFTVAVNATAAGTLRLQVPAGAIIKNSAGLIMDTTSAVVDDTTLTVVDAPPDITVPTPDPMTFAAAPSATLSASITMQATAASDTAGVEYYFTESSGNPGGSDSGWQGSRTYNDTGLTAGLIYTYTVTARDLSANHNATAPSAPASTVAKTPVVQPTITAPTTRHIVQRSSANLGNLKITGTYSAGAPNFVEARAVVMTGTGNNGTTTAWQTIDPAPSGGNFSGTLSNVLAGGWYQIEVRSVTDGILSTAAIMTKVGVGDIFVTAGQSNSANSGEATQLPQDDRISARTSTTDSTWVLAVAPLPIANGTSGSVWTWFANKMIAIDKVPIGFVSIGRGGTQAVSWTAGGTLYNTLLSPAVKSLPVNGFRAALWHQGESDSTGTATTATYSGYLNAMITQSRIDAGWNFPWYLAEVSFNPGCSLAKQEPIAAGQRLTIHGNPLTYFGPSTDELHATGGGTLHFNAVGLDAHARQWADILQGNVYLAPLNGDFEVHGWLQFTTPFPTGPTPLADGASTILDIVSTGQLLRVLNWRILSANGQSVADGSNGFHNPTTGTYAGAVDSSNGGVMPRMAGKHVAMLDGGSANNRFLQSSRIPAAPNTIYTLTTAIGVRDDPASFGNARLEITAKGAVVASGVFTKASLDTLRGSNTAGSFTDASISWTTGTTIAANQPLAIRIVKEGGVGTVLDFDNVRLTSLLNNFSSWISNPTFGLAPADQGFALDPDGDGLPNGLEAWFGTNPGQANTGLTGLTTNGTTTTFTHSRNATPPIDLAGFYQWSPNLLDWYASGTGPGDGSTVTFVPVNGSTTTTVTATSSPGMKKTFLRAGTVRN